MKLCIYSRVQLAASHVNLYRVIGSILTIFRRDIALSTEICATKSMNKAFCFSERYWEAPWFADFVSLIVHHSILKREIFIDADNK